MAGVQVAGLVSGINWQNIVNELVQADSAGMNQVASRKAVLQNQGSALGAIGTGLTNLEDAVLGLQDPTLFTGVTASSTTSGSTWNVTAASGTPTGNYQINVSRLATASRLTGTSDISQGLSSSDDVSGTTLATLNTALAPTAGTFTVNGQKVTVALTDSLQDVFDKISTATGGAVTGAYHSDSDTVTLTGSGPIVLGASNDSSNLLQALKLNNNSGSSAVTSTSALGTLQVNNTIANSKLAAAVTDVDGSGNGSFAINGVTINFNVNTDTVATVLGRINNSGAGVNAAYDAADDRVVLTNTSTGDLGMGTSEASGGLLAALGVTGGTLTEGVDAQYSLNSGPTQTSHSNTLDASALGVKGLTVQADTTGIQTIQVAQDTSRVTSAVQTFIDSFNTLQSEIGSDTATTSANGTVTTSVLSSNLDVADWGSSLQATAFGAGSGVGGINGLDALGIDFNGTTGQLTVTDSSKLSQALATNPSGVAAFLQTGKTGFASIMGSAVVDTITQNTALTNSNQSQVSDLTDQITTMQTQLDQEQAKLEAEFTAMEDAEAKVESEMSSLGSLTGSSSSAGVLSTATPTVTPSSSSSGSITL